MKNILKYLRSKAKHIKVFDWILIAFGFFALLLFIIIFFRKSEYITVTVSVGSDSVMWGTSGPEYWYAGAFQKGQEEKDGLGRIQAEVLNVFSYDKSPTNKVVYLDVKLNTVYNRSSNTYTYNGIPVLVGSDIKLTLDNVYVDGLVTEVQGFPGHSVGQNITVEAQILEDDSTFPGTLGTDTYIADAIHVGDVVYDNHGSEMIKVLSKTVTPAKITVNTSDGRVIEAYDPMKKDVYLTLQILAEKIGGKYFFLNDIPILVGQSIPINTQTSSTFPVVTKFLSY
jgi:hypothetical protein